MVPLEFLCVTAAKFFRRPAFDNNRRSGALDTATHLRKFRPPGLLKGNPKIGQNESCICVKLPCDIFEKKRKGIKKTFEHRKFIVHHRREFNIAGDIKTVPTPCRDRFKFIKIKILKTVREFA